MTAKPKEADLSDFFKKKAPEKKQAEDKPKKPRQVSFYIPDLAFIQLKKGQTKEARLNLMGALKAGIPDKESMAAVYLQLCSIEIQRKQNKIGKEYFRKAKALKPKSEEIVKQLTMMEKNIARLPG